MPALRPRGEWLLDPDTAFLNHGSYGATPRVVLAAQDRWRERLERRPTRFMSDELKSLVDGAHAPGILTLDVPAIGADWYVGNCHKWLMAPKGSGFLWASRSVQAVLHPLVISHGYGRGFSAEFDWIGTRDPTAWLAVPDAIELHQRLGGQKLRARNAALAREAATMLAKAWGTERGTADALSGSMAAVRLPVRGPASAERAAALRIRLFEEHRIEVAVTAFADALWARVSAQAYNEPADYERLARVFPD
jgi:isopenicillin-N epimerase